MGYVLRHSVLAALLLALVPSAYATTLYVANDGSDGSGCAGCGPKGSPCRSMSCAIANAVDGDKVIVGPGAYGDLDGDGALGGAGEEAAAAGCGCMLAVNKAV